jgi:serine/threonine protein kinase
VKIGSYELLEVIGRGGTSTVYRGQHVPSGQVVAVKVMAAELAANPVLLRRFEQEFAAACRLTHPHIVAGREIGLENGVPYLVMEFVEGRNLGQRVREQGPLAYPEAIRLILQIAGALRLAHTQHLIHRDVKPENILLTVDDQARLTDLGLIKDLEAAGDLTRSRACLGTAAYMAPEQFEDARHADVRSDVYGLAGTLYFALTGVPPFRGRGNLGILRKKLSNDLVPPGQLIPSLPVALDRIICAALDASPARRPRSCDEWVAALHSIVDTSPCQPGASASKRESNSEIQIVNRRGARRYSATLEASCRRLQSRSDQWSAMIQDISMTGVRLELNRRFETGTVLSLDVLSEQDAVASSLLMRVCWVRDAHEKKWSVGCAFHQPLSAGELDTLLECQAGTVVLPSDENSKPR